MPTVVEQLLAYASIQSELGFLGWSQDKNPSWSAADQAEYDGLAKQRDDLTPGYRALLARTDAPWLAWVAAVRTAWEALPDDKRGWSAYSLFDAWPANLYAAVDQVRTGGQLPSVPGVYTNVPDLLARYGDNEAFFAAYALAEGRAPDAAAWQAERDTRQRDQDAIEAEVKQILARTDKPWLELVAAVKALVPDADNITTGLARLKAENKVPLVPGL